MRKYAEEVFWRGCWKEGGQGKWAQRGRDDEIHDASGTPRATFTVSLEESDEEGDRKESWS